MTKEEQEAAKEFELRREIEENPLKLADLVENKLTPKIKDLEEKLSYQTTLTGVEKAMAEINKEYDIDWDKNSQKILKQMDNFSAEAKRKNPKGVLLAAARLAEVIQKKDKPDISFVESSSGYIPPKVKKTLEQKYKERIMGNRQRTSDNVFGL